jgi:hypothetical protein
MKNNISILDIDVFEWYDGLVLGLIQTEQFVALAYLLAFNPDQRQKRFCILPIAEQEAEHLRMIFKSTGPQAMDQQVFASILTGKTSVYLTCDEPERGKMLIVVDATPGEREHIPTPRFPLIDTTVDPGLIAQWLPGV